MEEKGEYQFWGCSGSSASRVTSKSGGREAAEAMEVRVRVGWRAVGPPLALWASSSSSSSWSSSSLSSGWSTSAWERGRPRARCSGSRGLVVSVEEEWRREGAAVGSSLVVEAEGGFSRVEVEEVQSWEGAGCCCFSGSGVAAMVAAWLETPVRFLAAWGRQTGDG